MRTATLPRTKTSTSSSSVLYNILNLPALTPTLRHPRWLQTCSSASEARCVSTTCPRTNQYTSTTTERDHSGTAGLSQEDRLGYRRSDSDYRFRLPTPEWRRR
eukprot:2138835-Pyramimonas_sp.AAC.1